MVTTAMMFFLLGGGPRVHRWWLDLAFLEVGRVLARAGRFSVSRPSVVMGPDACARSDLSVVLGTEGRARGRPASRSEAPSRSAGVRSQPTRGCRSKTSRRPGSRANPP